MPVEVRYQGKGKARHIDEIVASAVSVHVEQMDTHSWFMSIEDADGTYYQFWFGCPKHRHPVAFRHQETTPPAGRAAIGGEG